MIKRAMNTWTVMILLVELFVICAIFMHKHAICRKHKMLKNENPFFAALSAAHENSLPECQTWTFYRHR